MISASEKRSVPAGLYLSVTTNDELGLLMADMMAKFDTIETKINTLIAAQDAKLCKCD